MTDAELVAEKLAFIETCVADLGRLARPERIEQDLREQRFAAYTLQVAIQAALDVASHVVSQRQALKRRDIRTHVTPFQGCYPADANPGRCLGLRCSTLSGSCLGDHIHQPVGRADDRKPDTPKLVRCPCRAWFLGPTYRRILARCLHVGATTGLRPLDPRAPWPDAALPLPYPRELPGERPDPVD